ncbi:OmpH family outer membrane protein [Arenicella xantha]|uniref:Periplasmic chaperone for outer membrane proteins Skp n=1 Tax=Arenicella xantha TaxID=644221 RepID=A0A395JQE5_9GAMM|nr:OmpH family outer membrane protein [Arenicella xantha]RBP50940.1 periplasmic chaperone for outer membrane proteins Skp [Arenicella xantha]
MLKRSLIIVAAFAAVFQTAIVAAEVKIGVYDARKILESLPSVQKEFKNLNAEFEPKQKEIAEKQQALLKLKEDIEKNAGTIYSEADLQAKQLEWQSKRRELQLYAEDTERLFNVRRNEAIRKFQTSVDSEVTEVAKEEGFDLILRSGVMFASPKVDITDKVLKRMSSK